jgi:hypothetical protein
MEMSSAEKNQPRMNNGKYTKQSRKDYSKFMALHQTSNTKQSGIFWIMGSNCNGFNDKIGGNEKIAKALEIKEDLDIDCLMYYEHQINFCHKDNKNVLKQMFQRKSGCIAVLAHNVHKDKHAGQVQEGGTGTI